MKNLHDSRYCVTLGAAFSAYSLDAWTVDQPIKKEGHCTSRSITFAANFAPDAKMNDTCTVRSERVTDRQTRLPEWVSRRYQLVQ